MNNPPIVTISDDQGIVDMLPVLFGFMPRESVIIIATEGDRNSFGFRMRADLPTSAPVDYEHFWTYLRQMNHDGKVIIITVSDFESRALDVAEGLIKSSPYEVLACVSAPNQTTISSLAEGSAERVGMPLLPSREAMANLYLNSSVAFVHEVKSTTGDVNEYRAAFRRVKRGECTREDIATLREVANDITLRDVAWNRMTRKNGKRHAEVWRQVAVYTGSPGAYALSSFGSYLQGDGAAAMIAAEAALREDASYSMAHLILKMLEVGVHPDLWSSVTESEEN